MAVHKLNLRFWTLGLRETFKLITVAGGSQSSVPVATAIVAMESSGRKIDVLIGDGVPLVGIGFLTKFGYKAIVDCKYKKVALQKA